MPRKQSFMRLAVATQVAGDFHTVFAAFDGTLLVELNPPIPAVKLLRFDGMDVGDELPSTSMANGIVSLSSLHPLGDFVEFGLPRGVVGIPTPTSVFKNG